VIRRHCVLIRATILTVLADRLIAPHEHDLAHVVNEPNKLHPVGVTALADALSSLDHMHQVGEAAETVRQ
jgi:hypothetical protein